MRWAAFIASVAAAATIAVVTLFIMALCDLVSTVAHAGVISDATPPARYQANRSAQVVTVDPSRIGDVCGAMMGMKPPPDRRWAGCTYRGLVYIPNPCASPSEPFAALLCHELAHAQSWPRDHPQ